MRGTPPSPSPPKKTSAPPTPKPGSAPANSSVVYGSTGTKLTGKVLELGPDKVRACRVLVCLL